MRHEHMGTVKIPTESGMAHTDDPTAQFLNLLQVHPHSKPNATLQKGGMM